MITRSSRHRLAGVFVALALAWAPAAHAQEQGPPPSSTAAEADELERLHRDTIQTRRLLADSVLIAGLVSIAGGAALCVPSRDDFAWRAAGVNTVMFGAINTVVALLALHGIGAEERRWESDEARAARRTPEGLAHARVRAAIDERRESVGHAINLGLGCAYVGVAGTAILASQLGVDHPKRWFASGIAIGTQAIFLIGIDLIGMAQSGSYHRKLVEGFAPSLSIAPTSAGSEMRFDVTATF